MPAVPLRFFVRAPKNPFVDGVEEKPKYQSNTKGPMIPKTERPQQERSRKISNPKKALAAKKLATGKNKKYSNNPGKRPFK